MQGRVLVEALSSSKRLVILDMLAARPRTLGELSEETGVSMPGVLKHLTRLEGLGLVEKRKVKGYDTTVRKLYGPTKLLVGDFSMEGMAVVKLTSVEGIDDERLPRGETVQGLAEDLIVQRRRVREETRRLGRMLDEFMQSRGRLMTYLRNLGLDDEETLVLQVLYGEESLEAGERALSRHFGVKESRKSIERALAGAGGKSK